MAFIVASEERPRHRPARAWELHVLYVICQLQVICYVTYFRLISLGKYGDQH
jgi:hypothetical protein